MDKNGHLHVAAIGLFTLLLVGAGCFYKPAVVVNVNRDVPPPVETACTLEAKECPDGSYVGRVPPNCEFAPCPPPVTGCTKELMICPDGSSVGRTMPNCEFEPCPLVPTTPPPGPTCKNVCGNGQCDEIVCMAIGCPCAETAASCPQDCAQR